MAAAYKAELSAKEVVEAAEAMESMKKEIADLKAQLLELLSGKRKKRR